MFFKTGDKELDEIPTSIVYSVVALIFCIFPGAVALYYLFRVIDDKKKGDAFTARYHAGNAKLFVTISYALGISFTRSNTSSAELKRQDRRFSLTTSGMSVKTIPN